MNKIEFLESLLDELDSVTTLEEAKDLLSEKIDEAYQEEELRSSLIEDYDTDNEDF